jgi:chromatin segregation and condensation protein Rec8/ScpA/Scc1 (kleisin family)
MRETLAAAASVVVVDQTPLHVYMDQIMQQLEHTPRLPFSAVFTPPYTRGRLVGLFLAVLELTKTRRVVPEQPDPFGDIWLTRVLEAKSSEERKEENHGSHG